MAYKRKRVGGVSTGTVLLLAAAGIGVVLIAMNMNKPAAPTLVTLPPGQSSATSTETAIAASLPLVTTLVSELNGDEEED
jgi:hypothetical protein